MRCLSTFSGCGWANGFTLTPLPPQMRSQIWRGWLKSHLMQVCKPCHYALIEAVEPFKLHLMSMAYLNEVFEHLLRLWMGIWLHIHIVTNTDNSPYFCELGDILPDASVQTTPLGFGWGCRTFQTASVTDGHMALHSHHHHHRHFPRFGKVGWNPTWCKCANHATTFWLRLQNLSNCIPCPCHTYLRGLSTFSGCGWANGFTLTLLPPQIDAVVLCMMDYIPGWSFFTQ